ncbi:MAG: tRNA uracil 4-sulfurtransferase ThiI [Eubacteriales bacterium]|nr:tRNA uracil 4-sulfurtransferase ThiI [Eubacteriales bacterium]
MNDILLLKLGEIVLKGLNRRSFEQKLTANLRRRLIPLGQFRVYCMQSTIYVEPESPDADLDAALEAAKKVFGIVSVTRAAACEKDKDAIAQKAIEYLEPVMRTAKSFKVESKRSDKRFPMTSVQLSQYVGCALGEAYPDIPADMHNPELTVFLEVREHAAYVHAAALPGAGGMPVGSNGTAVTLLSGGIDSPVSSWMIARRGVRLIPVHFFSFPYTSELAKEKVLTLAKHLSGWCGRMTVEVVPFTEIQTQIREKCPEELFTLIMRRFMMRISERIALANGAGALVTGENLGQVASQTMEALRCTEAVCTLPILRPLIGMDKEEIVQMARKLGTFETSILPYEDCCTVFTPKHPRTKPRLSEVEEAEAVLDVEGLTEAALAGIERIRIELY